MLLSASRDQSTAIGGANPGINPAESALSHNQAFDALSGLSDELLAR